jgi:hypothetical protein
LFYYLDNFIHGVTALTNKMANAVGCVSSAYVPVPVEYHMSFSVNSFKFAYTQVASEYKIQGIQIRSAARVCSWNV